MKIVFARRLSIMLSVTAVMLTGGLSAQAETVDSRSTDTATKVATPKVANLTPTPRPGTTTTSAADLTQLKSGNSDQTESTAETSSTEVAQVDIIPGQPTRGGSSYIGVAGSIGLSGDSALGEDVGFTVISKIGLARTFSARPSVVIDDDPVILLPITYDFSIRSPEVADETISIAPYIGGGIGISTGGDEDDGIDEEDFEDIEDNEDDDDDESDADVGVLLTAGVDVPISEQITGTAAVNVGFFDDAEVGLLFGVGYNF